MKHGKKNQHVVYADYAATTPVSKDVLRAMLPYFSQRFGNASSIYSYGLVANEVLNDSRRVVADILHALPQHIVFTSGGTESNNLALYGTAYAEEKHGKHIITTGVEHHAVLLPVEDLKKRGWEITYIPVDRYGFVNPQEVRRALRRDTVLVSIMYANNEVGTIQSISEIGREILKFRTQHTSAFPYFHTDACQAAMYLDLDVEKLHVDLMSISASKLYGPKGVGMLYIRKGVKLKPLLYGGNQELHRRAGTENIPGIVGLAKALQLAHKHSKKESKRLEDITHYFWKKIQTEFLFATLNGPDIGINRLPGTINICFKGFEAEQLLIYLDKRGVMCSTGSACNLQGLDTSHVLKSIGLSVEEARSSLRFSFGQSTKKADIDYIIKQLVSIMKLLTS